ncbi:DNA-directed RNA polymerase subunit omega [Oceanococcus atlanticus]|uniref:DNA-directed RNA polymerase subunit omega n=1 Tax=Oceanococcus atlanticus TaxID=1317117 RepID=A0A1Y1SBS0_9GAMM|nr:DNA-directed RNA polymerase subunit omega [Oceanococcus atlanticus]ORE85563.1 DNA-directed RNA polymerase subunit omega [Oceanococcus atlanticus]
MARVTVEDCLKNIDNQFELTLVAAKRARQLARGADSKVPWGNHKSTVVALREVADDLTGRDVLSENDPPPVPQLKVDLSNIEVGTD